MLFKYPPKGGFFMERIEDNQTRIKILDTTLRDGFQSPGVNVDPEQRFELAKILERTGVDVIEAGFPASNQERFESVHEIASELEGPVIAALARANAGDIDRAWDAVEPAKDRGGARIHTFIATSEIHMRDKLRMTPEQVIQRAIEAVTRAKNYTQDVEFSAEDATRSDPQFLIRVVLEAVEAGATTINIPDTVGFASPREYARLISFIKSGVDQRMGKGIVSISTHCHDDRGLAVINTLEGIRSGARQVEVTINGIGERAGNASLEEVVANLIGFPKNFEDQGKIPIISVNPRIIFDASKFVEEITGMAIAPNKSIVGRNAFAHESGIHAAGVLANPETYEIFTPETFGISGSKISIGAESGHNGIMKKAEELGLEIGDSVTFTSRVKGFANDVRRPLTDAEIIKLAES